MLDLVATLLDDFVGLFELGLALKDALPVRGDLSRLLVELGLSAGQLCGQLRVAAALRSALEGCQVGGELLDPAAQDLDLGDAGVQVVAEIIDLAVAVIELGLDVGGVAVLGGFELSGQVLEGRPRGFEFAGAVFELATELLGLELLGFE